LRKPLFLHGSAPPFPLKIPKFNLPLGPRFGEQVTLVTLISGIATRRVESYWLVTEDDFAKAVRAKKLMVEG
jgi:hypothetical protein